MPMSASLRIAAAAAGAAFLVSACGTSTSGNALKPIGSGLQGRNGMHATVYARGIRQMSAFALDSRGRLWVTRSGASTHAHDAVYVVARHGATPVKVVSSIRGPLGLVWAGSRLFVGSLDGVYRFSGFDGRRFKRRTMILKGPAAAENNNLVVAPNGRLVMGVSANCDHCRTSPRYSADIVSFNTDGSDLRVVASGIRAAYGLAYYRGRLYASMNQRDDLSTNTPGDWIATVKNGQNWGFPACYGQGGGACDGVPSPLGVLHAHAAAGGVAISGGEVLTAEWARGTVMAVPLGGGRATPMLTGLSHPLPLAIVPDGALLVGDWGSGVVYSVARVA
jgi:glucose/arabinose dehydrogenase